MMNSEIDQLRRQLAGAKEIIAGLDRRAVAHGHERAALCAQAADVAGERAANAVLTAEIERLRAALAKARAGLSGGLWDYGPGHDEHDQCNTLVAEIDAALGPNAEFTGGPLAARPVE